MGGLGHNKHVYNIYEGTKKRCTKDETLSSRNGWGFVDSTGQPPHLHRHHRWQTSVQEAGNQPPATVDANLQKICESVSRSAYRDRTANNKLSNSGNSS